MLDRLVVVPLSRLITSADRGAMLKCDGVASPDMVLPAPVDFGVGFVGVMKHDLNRNTISNPVTVTPPAGLDISGRSKLWLMLRGENYIVGCDGNEYSIIAFNQPVPGVRPHRTFSAQLGAEVYEVKMSDRDTIIRVRADACHAAVQLPPRTAFNVPGGGYINSFRCHVEKVDPSSNYVEVRAWPGDGVNNQPTIRLSNFNDCVSLDNDSNEWKVIGRGL